MLTTVNLLRIYSQEIIWECGVFTFFDNREYFNNYVQPQSMLGIRPFIHGGLNVDQSNKFLGGISYLDEFGSRTKIEDVKPAFWFEHKSKYARIDMGVFPRQNLFELPYVLQHDTFQYYRPYVEGIFLEFSKPWGTQNVWLDWTSRQTNLDRETFLIGGTGKFHTKILNFRYDFIMYHFAGTAIPDTNDHIRDNGGLSAQMGLNLSAYTLLDTLIFYSGITGSYDRLRNVYNTDYRLGSLSEIYANYKGFGIRSTIYFGEGQTQMVGDGLYSAKFYSRIDFIVNLFRKSRVKSKIKFSLHMLPEVIDVSQQFTIYIALSGKSPPLKHIVNKN
jgi:hypothetical protein